jgi:hypothetical protein
MHCKFVITVLIDTLLDTSKKICLEINTEKTKQAGVFMAGDQYARQNHNITITDKSFENLTEFKYLGTTVTNQIYIYKEVKSRADVGNACYHSAHFNV